MHHQYQVKESHDASSISGKGFRDVKRSLLFHHGGGDDRFKVSFRNVVRFGRYHTSMEAVITAVCAETMFNSAAAILRFVASIRNCISLKDSSAAYESYGMLGWVTLLGLGLGYESYGMLGWVTLLH